MSRREQSPIHTKSHSFTHRHMCKKEKRRENHTHTETDRPTEFIPYFSETETSGDIISDRERERDSVEKASETEKKIVFFSFLVVDLCQKQTNRTSVTAPRSFSFSECVCVKERGRM